MFNAGFRVKAISDDLLLSQREVTLGPLLKQWPPFGAKNMFGHEFVTGRSLFPELELNSFPKKKMTRENCELMSQNKSGHISKSNEGYCVY